jgi:3-oxoacyl-[acyl-carrier protein] reductase
MKKLEGKVGLVTGSGRGLGEKIALEMAGVGMNVVINDVIKENARAAANKIREINQKVLVSTVDISDSTGVKAMVKETIGQFGRIDVLVNNAGISPKKQGGKVPIFEIEDEEWDLVIAVNLRGAFYCIREVSKEMMKARSGSIVNIASISGKTGNSGPAGAHYGASKAGLINLTKSAARELASFNIRVNAIAPGVVDTPLRQLSSKETNEALLKVMPMGRFASMEEIAQAVIFLASDQASYITGVTLDINGGWWID